MLQRVQNSMQRLAAQLAPAPLQLKEFDVHVHGLAPAHEGLRLAHLSDLHVGWATRSNRIQEALALVHKAKPDLVAMTGDYICLSRLDIAPMRRALQGLRGLRVIATLGNHDFWAGPERVASALRDVGCDVMRNEHRNLEIRGERLWVVGVDDPVTEADDVDRAFSGVPQHEKVPLVLAHCGRIAHSIAKYPAGLILSGHTHGGQVEIPNVTDRVAKRMGMPYIRGLHEVGETKLYVTQGIGNSALPFRAGHGAQPEVALITLRGERRSVARGTAKIPVVR
tara:strand:- start:38850 stop:39692 length:843 start_codon:yes stop_codon:yes gene_type:complete